MTILVNWNIYKPKLNGFQEARLICNDDLTNIHLNYFKSSEIFTNQNIKPFTCNDHLSQLKYLQAKIKWLSRSQINMQWRSYKYAPQLF